VALHSKYGPNDCIVDATPHGAIVVGKFFGFWADRMALLTQCETVKEENFPHRFLVPVLPRPMAGQHEIVAVVAHGGDRSKARRVTRRLAQRNGYLFYGEFEFALWHRASTALWSLWTLSYGIVFSAAGGIFHAYYLDEECIEEMLKSGSAIGPTLTFLRNIVDFTQPHEPAATKGRIDDTQAEFEIACVNLRKAHTAGVPMLTGTDSGFAVTPYGEWHARELEIFVEHLGFTPAEALRATTEVTSRFMADGRKIGVLERGRVADFIAVDGSPLQNVSILLDKSRIRAVHIDGKPMHIPNRGYDPRQVTDFAWTNWNDLYTQERVAALREARLAAE